MRLDILVDHLRSAGEFRSLEQETNPTISLMPHRRPTNNLLVLLVFFLASPLGITQLISGARRSKCNWH